MDAGNAKSGPGRRGFLGLAGAALLGTLTPNVRGEDAPERSRDDSRDGGAHQEVFTGNTQGANVDPALTSEMKLRGEYMLVPPDYSLEVWKLVVDRLAIERKNFVYWWGSGLFRSKRYPDAFFYRGQEGNYLSSDEIRELIRHAQSKGIKFYMAVGGLAWLTVDTLAELYPETRAKGSLGMCPSNSRAHEINVGWIEELYQAFPGLDGIMVELRDEYGPCNCEVCQTRIDQYGSQKYGQGELKFLKELSERIWKTKPDAEIVVCIGYGEHRAHVNDVAFYGGIRALGKDSRWMWLEVRGHWKLPGAGGVPQPLRYFSPRVVSWYQPEYHTVPELAAWLRKAAQEQLEGVCLGREAGSWSLLYGIREGNQYLSDSFRKHLAQFTFTTMAANPGLTDAQLGKLAAEEFFGPESGPRQSAALLYLDNLLLQAAKGVGPAGNYYSLKPESFRELLQKAAEPALSSSFSDPTWTEVFARTRAIQKAAELEGNPIREIARWAADFAPHIRQEKSDLCALVEKELDFFKQLLYLEEGDAALLAKAYSRAAANVSSQVWRVVATSEANAAARALNLFDGDPKTNWLCRNAVPLPQFVTVELPATKAIERISLSQSSVRLDYNTHRYRLEGSLDGYNFESWVEGDLPLELGASRTHDFSGRQARFVRVIVLSIHPDAPYSSPALSEVDIIAEGKSVRELLRE